jgi:hypothetical protein
MLPEFISKCGRKQWNSIQSEITETVSPNFTEAQEGIDSPTESQSTGFNAQDKKLHQEGSTGLSNSFMIPSEHQFQVFT